MALRNKFVAGNWKMHLSVAEGVALVTELRALLDGVAGVRVAVAPAFTAIHPVADALRGSLVEIGGQNVHWEKQGAFTGEVSPEMLVEAGATCAIVGHSERRQLFGETDEGVRKRARAALDAGLTPIVCVGETLAERDAGRTLEVVGAQVRAGLEGFDANDLAKLAIAYEPVWAIGTGRTATSAQAQEVHAAIRAILRELVGDAADCVPIQYGGSVKPENAAELMAQPDVDGALVGGASLSAASFAAIVRAARDAV
ncbi:triose-phosphate isomerase [Vulgatibacter incomptus]|uniref:Triosephosphate isomerase n=1 Tax=Vulgatibacter incomptus TaxID=1391653 RepID=A0A0K1PAB7_9BACT|nr:triose-phosphate isomerase [Vulgatibacter incomptus]AKU90460.1 Triosephosphate isomerase [Vulgatibacter incomptus]